MKTFPAALVAAAAAMILGQTWKIIRPVFSGHKPFWGGAVQSGGMPSSHTAAVAALCLMTGLRDGFTSSVFAVAFVLTAVVAHDAVKVRGSMNTIIRVLRKTMPNEALDGEKELPETVGHSVFEVVLGFVLAGVVALGCHLILPQ